MSLVLWKENSSDEGGSSATGPLATYPGHSIPECVGSQGAWLADSEAKVRRSPTITVHIHIAVLVSKGTGLHSISG